MGVNYAFKPQYADNNFNVTNGGIYKVVMLNSEICKLKMLKILDSVDGRGKENYRDFIIGWRNSKLPESEFEIRL